MIAFYILYHRSFILLVMKLMILKIFEYYEDTVNCKTRSFVDPILNLYISNLLPGKEKKLGIRFFVETLSM